MHDDGTRYRKELLARRSWSITQVSKKVKVIEKLKTHMIVVLREWLRQPEFQLSDQGSNDIAQLDISKRLSNTPMSSSTKWLIRTFGTLGNHTESVIDLLATDFVIEGCVYTGSRGIGACGEPAVRVPFVWITPYVGVHSGDER